jgi:anaerobic dimethyl sulfoxide reductase subunit A
MAAALQAMTGNIGVLGGSAEGVGKAWHAEAVAYPYDQFANIWFAAIKSDRWAHCVLNYPNVSREEIGLWPREDQLDGVIPNIKGIFWQGSDWFNQLTNINKEIEAMEKMELVVCMDSTITPSGLYADVLLPVATHFERHDVALPWYKGHYYIHRPKVIEPMGESKTDFQIFTELAYRIGWKTGMGDRFGKTYNPKADRSYFENPDAVDEAYLQDLVEHKVMAHQHVDMPGMSSSSAVSTSSSWTSRTSPSATRSSTARRSRRRRARSRSCRRSWRRSRTGGAPCTAITSRPSPSGSSPGSR